MDNLEQAELADLENVQVRIQMMGLVAVTVAHKSRPSGPLPEKDGRQGARPSLVRRGTAHRLTELGSPRHGVP